MSTINYDRPVEDLIAGLNATGHITHANWNKTMVTFHHNGGGPYTAQQVLNIWKSREASAHFDVEANGSVAQFANTGDYAWACANTYGNETSISIEMANSTGAPNWEVSETTWKSAARLAGWLFAHVIKAAPTRANVVYHSHWYPTACAGPYMDSVYNELLAEVQAAYQAFTNPQPNPTPRPVTPPNNNLTVDGLLGPATITRWQNVMGTPADGVITSSGSALVRAVQEFLNAHGGLDEAGHKLAVDGICDMDNTHHDTKKQHTIAGLQRYLRTPNDGIFSGPPTGSTVVKALQSKLNNAKNGSKEF
jgi:hypothetical protein